MLTIHVAKIIILKLYNRDTLAIGDLLRKFLHLFGKKKFSPPPEGRYIRVARRRATAQRKAAPLVILVEWAVVHGVETFLKPPNTFLAKTSNLGFA